MATYKDCLILAAAFLQLDEAAAFLRPPGYSPDAVPDDVAAEVETLTMCARLAVDEAARDYVRLIKTAFASSNNKRLYFSALDQNLTGVADVRRDGKRVPFKLRQGFIEVKTDALYEVTFAYAPQNCAITDELPWGNRIPPRAIAYGAACEYCLINGVPGEAALWNKRFKDALAKLKTPLAERVVKRRRWIL
ncbi:MAG: hypothetical protein LBP26_02630 [Clostridiales bacterium]|jgi:hypothetical protein|nr:hypothetical protein [Clostridiales bacterium]